VLAAGLAMVVAGCVGPLTVLRRPNLDKAREVVDQYGTDLRWGRVDEAAEAVHPEQRAAFRRLLSGREDRLRMTDFEVESVGLLPDRRSATAFVRYSLYRLPHVVEEPRREEIRLRWLRRRARWYVEPDLTGLALNLGLDPVGGAP
jgi:hypothetical protein